MSIDKIKVVLKDKIGLHAQSIGDSSFHIAIEKRLNKNKITQINEYVDLLSRENQEVTALIEEIVVPETWFFRNRPSFEYLSKFVDANFKFKSTAQPCNSLRVLSLPCSTGEEPYSIAIQLSQSGALMHRIDIDAVDISARSLQKARLGIYTAASLRDTPTHIQEKYFSPLDNNYQLKKQFRELINFKQGNFMTGPISPVPSYYDVIFCRNLLIYFDAELQQVAFEKLFRALKPEGLLILGHAESATIKSKFFYRGEGEKAHAFRRVDLQEKSPVTLQANKKALKESQTDWKKEFGCEAVKSNSKESNAGVNRQYKNVNEISVRLIEKLVLKGNHVEAESLIDQLMQKNSNNSYGYYLFALLKYKNGEVKLAESILKKAIYLEPNHEKSIELLIVIAKAKADLGALSRYQKRLLRIRGQK